MRTSSPSGTAGAASTTTQRRSSTNGARVLVVDDSVGNLELLDRLLSREGFTVLRAGDGEVALPIVQNGSPDIVITDVMMPRKNGLELCRAIKEDAATRLIPVVLLTSLSGTSERIAGIEAGADDFITKPFDAHELSARIRSLLRIKRYTDELDSAEAVIISLALTIEARDACTEGHCQRLASAGAALGSRIGLPADDVLALQRGGVLHDIGKVAIPDAILLKPGRLTSEEFDRMKTHTVVGDRLCSELRFLENVRPIVRHHHERLDGSGYPDGLRGVAVPLLAQIVGIVDVYDALTTSRPYRNALTAEHAFEELRSEVQRGWRDEALVSEFIAMFTDSGRGD